MPKYNIESNIDFYSEISKCDINNYNEENICLISNEILREHFVTLDCNHKFNYIDIFKDTLNHKKNLI